MADENARVYTHSIDTKQKLIAGVLIVIGIAFSWVGTTQFAASTYTKTFNAPSFTSWFMTSWMTLAYGPIALWSALSGTTSIKKTYRLSEQVFGTNGLCPRSWFKITLPFGIIWSTANYSYLRALGKIAATDVTALFSSCNAFVYIFSLLLLPEPFRVIRILSVIMSMSGIVMIAYADGFKGPTFEGVALSILAAISAALYKVLFKRVVGDANVKEVSLFLSCIGIFNLLVLWPIFEILYYTNEEIITWDEIPWSYLCGGAVLGVIFNFFINFGIAITFPLFISLGTLLGIPVNALVDTIFRHKEFGGFQIGAGLLIIGGFLLMLVPENINKRFFKRNKSYGSLNAIKEEELND
eukprot:gene17531-19281_t